MKTAWPKTVPVLSESQMDIGPYNSAPGCGCLAFWNDDTFPFGRYSAEANQIRLALVEAHDQLDTVVANDPRRAGIDFVTCWSDEELISKSLLARVWNRAVAILGYVVNNPECTPAGRLKPVKKAGK